MTTPTPTPNFRADFRGLIVSGSAFKMPNASYTVELFESQTGPRRGLYKARIVGAGEFGDIPRGPLDNVKALVEAKFRERVSDWVVAPAFAPLVPTGDAA